MKNRILIVEDEQIIAEDLKETLKNIGFEDCLIENSAEQALEIIKKQKPDLIIIDIKLTGEMDGIELAENINKIEDIPVIYFTAYSDEKVIEKAMATKPVAYLIKPVVEKELLDIINSVLNK